MDLDVQNITSIRRFDLYLFNEKEQISGWKTKAFAQQHEVREWKIVNNSDQQTINPRWHKSSFTWNPDNGSIVKVRLNQLSKGCFG